MSGASYSDAASYYKNKMRSYLDSNRLPPTAFELREKDAQVRDEIKSRFDEKKSQTSLVTEYESIQQCYKQRRYEMLIEAVLGTKNYVPQIN